VPWVVLPVYHKPKLSNNPDNKKYAELVLNTFYLFSIQTGQVFALIINFKAGKCILIINIPMNRNIFEQEFNRRYKGTNVKPPKPGAAIKICFSGSSSMDLYSLPATFPEKGSGICLVVLKAVGIAWQGEGRGTFHLILTTGKISARTCA
jgi:hypothetical protein